MRIAVIGATGTAGRPTVELARAAGHEVRGLSRSTGVDLQTGEGLIEALTGAEVAINTSNAVASREGVEENFAEVTTRLASACLDAGISRLVHLSICNIDDPGFDDFGYYRAKRAQERVLTASALETTIVRSAQWMEFALNPGAVTMSEDRVEVEDWLVQPIAVDAVAAVLVEAASGASRDRQVAGPEAVRLPALTRRLLSVTHDPRPVVEIPAAQPAFSDGTLLAPDGAELLCPTPAHWVASQADQDSHDQDAPTPPQPTEESMTENTVTVEHRSAESRYVLLEHPANAPGAQEIGEESYVDVAASGGDVDRVMFHTLVAEDHAGLGLASTLVRAAVEDTVAAGLRIAPVCPYVKAWLPKHPEFAEHVVDVSAAHLAAVREAAGA